MTEWPIAGSLKSCANPPSLCCGGGLRRRTKMASVFPSGANARIATCQNTSALHTIISFLIFAWTSATDSDAPEIYTTGRPRRKDSGPEYDPLCGLSIHRREEIHARHCRSGHSFSDPRAEKRKKSPSQRGAVTGQFPIYLFFRKLRSMQHSAWISAKNTSDGNHTFRRQTPPDGQKIHEADGCHTRITWAAEESLPQHGIPKPLIFRIIPDFILKNKLRADAHRVS